MEPFIAIFGQIGRPHATALTYFNIILRCLPAARDRVDLCHHHFARSPTRRATLHGRARPRRPVNCAAALFARVHVDQSAVRPCASRGPFGVEGGAAAPPAPPTVRPCLKFICFHLFNRRKIHSDFLQQYHCTTMASRCGSNNGRNT